MFCCTAPDTTKSRTQGSSTEKVLSSPASSTIDSALRTSDGTHKPTSITSTGAHKSGGASIGVIIGGCLLAIIFFVFIAVFFYRKRKQRAKIKAYGGTEDEKSAGLVSGAAATAGFFGGASINEKADSVSLRTITQFDNLDPPAASPIVKTGPSGGAGRHAIPRKPIPSPLVLSKPLQPDPQPTTTSAVQMIPTAQPSPTLSAFSGSSVPGTPAQDPVKASALVATGKPTPVHRVQMDYSPSQPDELDIRTGQLVRMLHAYDDGWVSFFGCLSHFEVSSDQSFIGTVCPHGSFATRCLSTYLSFRPSCQTSSQPLPRFSSQSATSCPSTNYLSTTPAKFSNVYPLLWQPSGHFTPASTSTTTGNLSTTANPPNYCLSSGV